MVINKLLKQLEIEINKYGINSLQAYTTSVRISLELDYKYNKNTIGKYYNKSYRELKKYIQNNENNPSELKWNKYALKNRLLSSQTIGYIDGQGFNKLCKQIRNNLKIQKSN